MALAAASAAPITARTRSETSEETWCASMRWLIPSISSRSSKPMPLSSQANASLRSSRAYHRNRRNTGDSRAASRLFAGLTAWHEDRPLERGDQRPVLLVDVRAHAHDAAVGLRARRRD